MLPSRSSVGPAQQQHHEGKVMKSAHVGIKIGNPEFAAALGDLKASLDKLQIPNKDQKELLSIIESTRPVVIGAAVAFEVSERGGVENVFR